MVQSKAILRRELIAIALASNLSEQSDRMNILCYFSRFNLRSPT
ncbi:hypothetical protein [Laspinema sp. D2d]|nr:hypothetical protein [Laspinema sp. D2d]